MNSLKRYLPYALFLGFLLVGLIAFMQSKPSHKNARIYKAVQLYSPYYLDKRFGGLQIMNKEDKEFKEKPTNLTLFSEFERLEKEWAQCHLKIEGETLIILDNNGAKRAELPLKTQDEITFVHHYYGL